jgi:hypothetical protein
MAFENLSAMQVYIALAINGIFTGLGVAIGTYIAQNHIIESSKKLSSKIKGRIAEKKQNQEKNGK